MTRAVVFNIDGTLVDSVDLHAEAWHEALKHFGHDIPVAAIRSQIGKGGDKLLPEFLPADEVKKLGDKIEKFRSKLFMQDYMPRVRPFPGVRELFEKIKGSGLKIGLASSAEKKQLKEMKKIARIDGLVDCDTSADDVEDSKPDPDVFDAVMKCLKPIPPRETVVVGDTPYDAEGARKAGLTVVGVLCGGFPESDLRAAGCVAIFRDPADLLEHYESSPLSSRAR